MNLAALLVYGVFGLIVLLALSALLAPVRWGLKLAVNALFGIIGLLIAGVFGSFIGLTISLNAVTIALTAILGLPGLALVIVLSMLLL